MQKIFREVTAWQQATFKEATPESLTKHLRNEVDELLAETQRGTVDDATKYEIADCFFLLFGIADRLGIDYDDIRIAIIEKLQINKERLWREPNKEGLYLHVR